jgi:membrane-bound acyltransferase YfiQ involved in biofilm formation
MFGWVIVSRQLHFHIYYLFVAPIEEMGRWYFFCLGHHTGNKYSYSNNILNTYAHDYLVQSEHL